MKKRFDLSKYWKLITDIPVSEIMITHIKSLNEDDTVQNAVNSMAKHSIASLIVQDSKGCPVGIVTEGDIIKKVLAEEKSPKKVKLKKIMTKDIFTITPQTSIGKASAFMKKRKISKLPVTENEKIVGFVTKSDILETTSQMYHQNRRLVAVVVSNTILLIVIVILILQLLKK